MQRQRTQAAEARVVIAPIASKMATARIRVMHPPNYVVLASCPPRLRRSSPEPVQAPQSRIATVGAHRLNLSFARGDENIAYAPRIGLLQIPSAISYMQGPAPPAWSAANNDCRSLNVRPHEVSDRRALASRTSRPPAALFVSNAERRQGLDRAGGNRPSVRAAHGQH